MDNLNFLSVRALAGDTLLYRLRALFNDVSRLELAFQFGDSTDGSAIAPLQIEYDNLMEAFKLLLNHQSTKAQLETLVMSTIESNLVNGLRHNYDYTGFKGEELVVDKLLFQTDVQLCDPSLKKLPFSMGLLNRLDSNGLNLLASLIRINMLKLGPIEIKMNYKEAYLKAYHNIVELHSSMRSIKAFIECTEMYLKRLRVVDERVKQLYVTLQNQTDINNYNYRHL